METRPVTLKRHHRTNVFMDMDQLAGCLEYWADQLVLRDWAIDFAIVRSSDIPGLMGSCSMTTSKKRATIRFMTPGDWSAKDDPYDMEQVTVHELLHLHFNDWLEWSDDHSGAPFTGFHRDVCMERPIDILAWRLVDMRRFMGAPVPWFPKEACVDI